MGLDLDNILNLADEAEKKQSQKPQQAATPKGQSRPQRRVVTPDATTLQEQIDSLDKIVYGKPVNNSQQGGYSAAEEMKRIEQIRRGEGVNVHNSGIPSNILESIVSNPLMMDPTIVKESNAVSQFVEQMSLKSSENGGTNIYDKMKSLVERTDAIDKREVAAQRSVSGVEEMLNEFDERRDKTVATPQQAVVNAPAVVDYALIKTIVRECVAEMREDLKKELLTESKTNDNSAQLNFMSIGEKFRMVDGNDNVYECQLKYIGKRKK